MQLRLGLLNEDVADRFNKLPTKSSVTFTTWINLLSKALKSLIARLPREAILDNLPEAFFETGHSKYRVILDYAGVFIKRPKSLQYHAVTWSNYKHNNAIKFLVDYVFFRF